jgi:hypothetical protein
MFILINVYQGLSFLRVGNLTWGTKLYSGGDITDIFSFAQSYIFAIVAMEIRMLYVQHDIVQIVMLSAQLFFGLNFQTLEVT